MNAGADDYMTKPFAFDGVRRADRGATAPGRPAAPRPRPGQVADLTLDRIARQVAPRRRRSVELTRKEYGLRRYLMENAGAVLSRSQLLNANWGYNFDPGTKVVDVYVRHLRKKIDDGEAVQLIQTVRGAGYCIGERA